MPLQAADLTNWHSLSPDDLNAILCHSNDSVPRLHRMNMSNAALVRYTGMVQDMFDPEYYAESLDPQSFTERHPLLLVPVPFAVPNRATDSLSCRDDVDMEHEGFSKKKRERDEEAGVELAAKKQSIGSPKATTAFSSDIVQPKQDLWPSGCMGSNPSETPVLAHFYYDLYKGSPLRLNDVVELIGVLEPVVGTSPDRDEGLDQHCMMEDDFFEDPEIIAAPIPRLRVVCHRIVDLEHDTIKEDGSMEKIEDPRLVKSYFAAALGGSEAAAEVLWLSLLSQAERDRSNSSEANPVKTPHDGGMLGCASLNLILPTLESCSAAARHLQSLLQHVFPVVGCLELKDTSIVAPTKTGRHMARSPLQLPKGSILIIVENRMDGKLSQQDVETMQALQSMTKTHSVPYRFEGGMRFDFEADFRIVVLSAKHRETLLPCTLKMELHSNISSSSLLSAEDCLRVRSLFASCRKPTNIRMGQKVLEAAQKDFIERRQRARASGSKPIEEEDFHRWLTLTRLYSRSESRRDATIDDWKNALRIDDAMRAS